MIQITKDYIPVNKYSRAGLKLKAKRGIVMHYTASPGAPAKNISKYFASLAQQDSNKAVQSRYASAHFSVDRTSIYNSLPDDELAYHCGSTTYTKEALAKLGTYPNNSTVGIEMCIEKDGSIHEDTFNNVVDLAVYLIRERGFPPVFFTHKEVVGWKECPLPWIKQPGEYERFKQAVHTKLNPLQEIAVTEDDDMNTVLDYAQWAWNELDQYIGDAYNDKVIDDWAWVEKVRKKKLTYGELLLLKVLIDERRRKKSLTKV
ncbi:N-acetylmuramoyl-L-alanine amidase [Paenibacillus sp. LS1]|uniref:peptidoglycan recognition protein family protein n=1 Tax=Paenibacillus sp. LS1 TaxID=2992120 RepID=UPI002230CC66|nr:N-acetylmuramoyl-L-alanine amidase [Paenibacillus sp. LS1]MCW3790965.1 N-acetylmuramoyl-L-alanine amidase [Paenibacillus sp. LS1]